mmetsp:Transcript_10572/g.25046  ORF Transcript_10572/g.25046 Transcript_10572/m.25046 type:complete len:167 (-) Transcript_10572:22-522(-)|eukprot:3068409-Rhodomonas_salina.2
MWTTFQDTLMFWKTQEVIKVKQDEPEPKRKYGAKPPQPQFTFDRDRIGMSATIAALVTVVICVAFVWQQTKSNAPAVQLQDIDGSSKMHEKIVAGSARDICDGGQCKEQTRKEDKAETRKGESVDCSYTKRGDCKADPNCVYDTARGCIAKAAGQRKRDNEKSKKK